MKKGLEWLVTVALVLTMPVWLLILFVGCLVDKKGMDDFFESMEDPYL